MRSLNNRRGQGLTEYVLLVVFMGLAAIGAIKYLSAKTSSAFQTAGTTLETQVKLGSQSAARGTL